jgi:hypothetical protein
MALPVIHCAQHGSRHCAAGRVRDATAIRSDAAALTPRSCPFGDAAGPAFLSNTPASAAAQPAPPHAFLCKAQLALLQAPLGNASVASLAALAAAAHAVIMSSGERCFSAQPLLNTCTEPSVKPCQAKG